MPISKLLKKTLENPESVYRKGPKDVLRDRRFSYEEHILILQAWKTSHPDLIPTIRDAENRITSQTT